MTAPAPGDGTEGAAPIQWAGLQALREKYLQGSAGASDYWSDAGLLDSYDRTLARRIAWKWRWVFRELSRRNWTPPAGPVLDWGCGTGVGAREFFGRWPSAGPVRLHDRSRRAAEFAAEAVRREFPEVETRLDGPGEAAAVLLVSHVLTELDEDGWSALLAAAQGAQSLLCVEPGTRAASDKIIRLRQALLPDFHPVAPCLHRAACGLLAPENAGHWCHFFANAPIENFTDPNWARFGKTMGIDLRSLPLSFLVMDRRTPRPPEPGSVRVLGQPRMYKGYALLLGCQAEGVTEHRFQQREDPAYFKQLNKGRAAALQRWRTEASGDIVEISDLPPPDSPP